MSCAVARPGRDSRAATLAARARQRQHVVDATVEDEILVQDAQHFLTAAADRIEEGPARPAPHQGDLGEVRENPLKEQAGIRVAVGDLTP